MFICNLHAQSYTIYSKTAASFITDYFLLKKDEGKERQCVGKNRRGNLWTPTRNRALVDELAADTARSA